MSKSLLSMVSSLFSMTDEQAMWRVQTQDDPHAFAVLVQRWEGPIQGLCTRMLGDPHKGQDLTQDAFARLFAKRKDYQPQGRLSTYLWRIALNLCYDELRRLKRHPETALILESHNETDETPRYIPVQPGADSTLEQNEQSNLVRKAVMQLSEAYRSVIILRHYENLKFREIADVLGIPEGTVKSRMAEALTQLHHLLAPAVDQGDLPLCKTPSRRMEESLVL